MCNMCLLGLFAMVNAFLTSTSRNVTDMKERLQGISIFL